MMRLSTNLLVPLFLGITASACLEPTQVTFDITTDLPCSSVNGTSISVGLAGFTEKILPTSVVKVCSDDGTAGIVGTYAVAPKKDPSVVAAIKVVMAVGEDVNIEDCTVSSGYAGCIVARRQISFLPHRKLVVPVRLFLACKGVACDESTTCNRARRCVPAQIDKSKCDANGLCGDLVTEPGEGLPCFNTGTNEPLFCKGETAWCNRDADFVRSCGAAPGTTGISFECLDANDCGPSLTCASGTNGILGYCTPRGMVTGPELTGVAILDASPTNHVQLALEYTGQLRSFTHHCILENATSPEACTWVAGSTLPLTYAPVLTSGPLALSVFVKNAAGLVSTVGTSNTVEVDRVPPEVSWVSPGGGEMWANSVMVTLKWQATDDRGLSAIPFSLSISSDDGTTWTSVASALTGNTYDWTTPVIGSARTRLRLSAVDTAGNVSHAVTGAFDLSGQPPAGGCRVNDAHFLTAEGGCKDLATGLVWSHGTGAYLYYDAVWDADLAGAAPSEWSDDYGFTNDYSTDSDLCSGQCDDGVSNTGSTTAYCHSLFEGGRGDWRLPTRAELQAAFDHSWSLSSGNHYLNNISTTANYWSSSGTSATQNWAVQHTGAQVVAAARNTPQSVICVRGNRSPPSKLAVVSGPSQLTTDAPPTIPLVVALQDLMGRQVNASGTTLTISGASAGTLGGTLTAVTGKDGRATFDGFTLAGITTRTNVTLTISAAPIFGHPIASTTHLLTVAPSRHICLTEDPGRWVTAEGGCKDVAQNLVWSALSPVVMSWHEATWDSALPGNSPPEPAETPRVNDYDPNFPPDYEPDGSLVNYCHSLVEGGYSDWRMPTKDQATTSFLNGGAMYFGDGVNVKWWLVSNAIVCGWTAHSHYCHFTMATGLTGPLPQTYGLNVRCVRKP